MNEGKEGKSKVRLIKGRGHRQSNSIFRVDGTAHELFRMKQKNRIHKITY